MSRQIIFTSDAAKPPVTYSQAVRAAGLIFVSGTAPNDPQTGALVGSNIQEQTRQCLKNISAILRAAGSSLDKVASVTVVLAELPGRWSRPPASPWRAALPAWQSRRKFSRGLLAKNGMAASSAFLK